MRSAWVQFMPYRTTPVPPFGVPHRRSVLLGRTVRRRVRPADAALHLARMAVRPDPWPDRGYGRLFIVAPLKGTADRRRLGAGEHAALDRDQRLLGPWRRPDPAAADAAFIGAAPTPDVRAAVTHQFSGILGPTETFQQLLVSSEEGELLNFGQTVPCTRHGKELLQVGARLNFLSGHAFGGDECKPKVLRNATAIGREPGNRQPRLRNCLCEAVVTNKRHSERPIDDVEISSVFRKALRCHEVLQRLLGMLLDHQDRGKVIVLITCLWLKLDRPVDHRRGSVQIALRTQYSRFCSDAE